MDVSLESYGPSSTRERDLAIPLSKPSTTNTKHQRISMNLTVEIGGWLKGHPIGRLVDALYDVVLSIFDVVEPDLVYLSNERAAAVMTTQNLQGAPELVVEINSRATRGRDETIKRRLYERACQA